MSCDAVIFVLSLSLLATPSAAQIVATDYVTGLTNPVAFVQDPSNAAIQYVVEQAGRIRVIRDGALLSTDFLDLRTEVSAGGERGLLGLAFPPDYAVSGRFFVNFTNPAGHTVVARFVRSDGDPPQANVGSRLDLRWSTGLRVITQPFANHNGGNIAFGSDGFLYIGMGDGGSGNDPDHRAQDPTTLLGKFLRIDVGVADTDPEGPAGFRVPADNPFLGLPGARPEIWSFGWRNPWRFSFDDTRLGGTGAMIAGDVGQGAWEEVDYEPAGRGGRNYGWRNREGAHDNVTNRPPAFLAADRSDLRVRPLGGHDRHRRVRLSRDLAARRCRAGTSSRTSPPDACGPSRWRSIRPARRPPPTCASTPPNWAATAGSA